jgi:hypothetical protein
MYNRGTVLLLCYNLYSMENENAYVAAVRRYDDEFFLAKQSSNKFGTALDSFVILTFEINLKKLGGL